MLYIIDANNLAGKLNLLSEDNFDKKLIAEIKNFFAGKNHQVILVFDSADVMGNKLCVENLTIIYSPKDNFYKSADDKIIELVRTELNPNNNTETINIITDDLELSDKMEKLALELSQPINIIKSTWFAKKIEQKIINSKEEIDDHSHLRKNEIDDINKELLQKFLKL